MAVTHRRGVLVLVLLGQSGAGPGLPGFWDTVLLGVWLVVPDSMGPLFSWSRSYITLAECIIGVLIQRYVLLLEVCPERRRGPCCDKKGEEEEISICQHPSELVSFF